MGLFSTLGNDIAKTSGNDGKGGKNATSSAKSLSVPTVVQLYTKTLFDLNNKENTINTKKGTGTNGKKIPIYAPLTYHAIEVANIGMTNSNNDMSNVQKPPLPLPYNVPDLGVWNCSCSSNNNNASASSDAAAASSSVLADCLLRIPDMAATSSSSSTVLAFCMTADLTQLSEVEPSLTLQQQALVRYLIENGSSTSSTATTKDDSQTAAVATTSLYELRSVQFGLAPTEKDEKKNLDEKDRNIRVPVLICVRVKPSAYASASSSNQNAANQNSDTDPSQDDKNNQNQQEDKDDYQTKQAQALVMYHLRRFAAALNANLVFVDESIRANDSSNNPNDSATSTPNTSDYSKQPVLSLQQLGIVWRELAQGKEIWKDSEIVATSTTASRTEQQKDEEAKDTTAQETEEEDEKGETNEEEQQDQEATIESAYSLIYGPGNHQQDLIESVLLRSAHFPGHWDASKDSIWKVMPSQSQQQQANANGGTNEQQDSTASAAATPTTFGDEDWLTELRNSITAPAGSTNPGASSSTSDPLKTPPSKKDAGAAGNSTQKASPKDTDVSSFFESLMS